MKNFEDKTVKVISKLTCNGCGEQASPSDSEFHEFISINHRCGYDSIHGDGNTINIDLCQQCFADMCGDSLRIIDPSDEQDDGDLQIAARDILLANKIINKDELAVALKRLDLIFGPQELSNKESEFYQLVELIFSFEGKSWDSYLNEVDAASDDFLVEREDIKQKKQ